MDLKTPSSLDIECPQWVEGGRSANVPNDTKLTLLVAGVEPGFANLIDVL
jgi:hypothetical protein